MGDQIVLAYSKKGLVIVLYDMFNYVECFFGFFPMCCCECFHELK